MRMISGARGALVAAVLIGAVPAAAINLVSNGGFETLTNGPNLGSSYTDAVGWTITSPGGNYGGKGYSIFFAAGAADGVGAMDNNGPGSPIVNLWGPGVDTMFDNGLPAASPSGGNFFASDADTTYSSAISQTISGLTIGQHYTLTFDWAGAQLFYLNGQGFYGDNYHSYQVSFGAQTQSTGTVLNQERHFTGWMSQTMYFTATGTSQLLSFLSVGGPGGAPPMTLLDGVSLAVPEPATWALMIAGFGAVGVAARRRKVATAAA